MNRRQIAQYRRLMGRELQHQGRIGEIVVVGGAMMLLKIRSRDSTQDIDAYYLREGPAIQAAAQVVAQHKGLPVHWLNDAMKGFLAGEPPLELWRDYPGLRVYLQTPAYLLPNIAMG